MSIEASKEPSNARFVALTPPLLRLAGAPTAPPPQPRRCATRHGTLVDHSAPLHNLRMTRTQERSSRPGSAQIARAVLVIGYGACWAAWVYADQKQIDLYSQGVYDFLHSMGFTVGAFFLLPTLVGCLVGRIWVLAALIGPLATLGYLQVTGYISPWHDGSPPLGVPSLIILSLSGGLLLLGVALRVGSRPRRVDPEDDWTWGK